MIKCQNLNFQLEQQLLFQNFCFSLNEGEHLALSGPSGVGKSTLLHLLMGHFSQFEGEILFDQLELNDQNIAAIRKTIAWVPQNAPVRNMKVLDFLMSIFQYQMNLSSISWDLEQCHELLEEFLLSEEILQKNFNECSGGERHRLFLIRAFMLKRPLLFLDEPTASLDENSKQRLLDYLAKSTFTILSVSHDPQWLAYGQRHMKLHPIIKAR